MLIGLGYVDVDVFGYKFYIHSCLSPSVWIWTKSTSMCGCWVTPRSIYRRSVYLIEYRLHIQRDSGRAITSVYSTLQYRGRGKNLKTQLQSNFISIFNSVIFIFIQYPNLFLTNVWWWRFMQIFSWKFLQSSV